MNNANQCPKCKKFILGTFCYNCKKEISEMNEEDPLFNMFGGVFKDIFKDNKK